MDLFKLQKFQAINKPKKAQPIDKFRLYSIALLVTCSITFLFTLSSLVPSPKFFFFVSIEKMGSVLLSSKSVFIVVNLIIIILIGESKFLGSNHSAPASEVYYEEYISRKRSLQASSSPVPDERRGRKMEIKTSKENGSTETACVDGGDVRRETGGDENLEGDKGKEELDREDDELSLPTEELRKRADDFIARVNRQRRLEARLQLCYC